MITIQVDIPDETLAMVDRLASDAGVSRSDVIGLALEQVAISVSFNDAMESMKQKQEAIRKLLNQ